MTRPFLREWRNRVVKLASIQSSDSQLTMKSEGCEGSRRESVRDLLRMASLFALVGCSEPPSVRTKEGARTPTPTPTPGSTQTPNSTEGSSCLFASEDKMNLSIFSEKIPEAVQPEINVVAGPSNLMVFVMFPSLSSTDLSDIESLILIKEDGAILNFKSSKSSIFQSNLPGPLHACFTRVEAKSTDVLRLGIELKGKKFLISEPVSASTNTFRGQRVVDLSSFSPGASGFDLAPYGSLMSVPVPTSDNIYLGTNASDVNSLEVNSFSVGESLGFREVPELTPCVVTLTNGEVISDQGERFVASVLASDYFIYWPRLTLGGFEWIRLLVRGG